MANWITLLRILLLFVGIGFIYSNTVPGHLIAFGIVVAVIGLDGLDGMIARREGRADETGATMDILGDRIVESTLWIVFAHRALIPVWVPLVVIVRGLATDAVRSLALARGRTAFGEERTMMESSIGRALVASRASRAVYATAKGAAFSYLILYSALIRAQAEDLPIGRLEESMPWIFALGTGWVYFTVAFCLVRGLPVLIEGWGYVRRR